MLLLSLSIIAVPSIVPLLLVLAMATSTPNSSGSSSSLLASKTIAVIGGGNVGSTLAQALVDSQPTTGVQRVVIAARDPTRTRKTLTKPHMDLPVQDTKTAIEAAEILILATPGPHDDEGIEKLVESLQLPRNRGKILIDATNPLTGFAEGLQVRWKQGQSGGEVLARCVPDGTFVYKAFNTLGVEHMKDAQGKDLLFAGDASPEPRRIVEQVIAGVGFRPFYVGPIRYSRNLEAMAELWIHCGIPALPGNHLGRDWTFGLAGNPERTDD